MFKILFFLVVPILIHVAQAVDLADITRLRQNILRNYDNESRPIQNHKNATVVDLTFSLEGFELDEKRNVLTVHTVCVLHWTDMHVKWDPKDYGNLTDIEFASYELWKPDLGVYNNVDASETDYFGNTRITASSDSTVYWFPPAKFQVACPLDLRQWPFDTQHCIVFLGSWAHNGEDISLFLHESKLRIWDANYTKSFVFNREWDIIFNSTILRIMNYSCCPEPYMHVEITMVLQRKGSTHAAIIVAVAYGIAAAMLVSFWLSPHAKERMPLILVTLMLNVFFLNIVYKVISSNGNSVPLVVAFYRDSLLMVTFSTVWTVLLRYIAASKRKSTVPLPAVITRFLNSSGAIILCLDQRPKQENSLSPEQDEKELVADRNPYQEDWTWLAYLLDRCMFIIYLVIYICFFCAFF